VPVIPLPTTPIDRTWTVFVDRDGVINRRVDGDYVRTVDDFHLLPGALDGLAALAERVGPIVVVTNQQGVGKGLVDPGALAAVHDRLVRLVSDAGGRIDAVLVCPHRASDGCDCRKPATGLARRAEAELVGVDLGRAVMIGDSAGDVGFARGLGIPMVLVVGDTSAGAGDEPVAATVDGLLDAARLLTAAG
jgi:D-glycero-D-manno-heptose 1,7-bisphosphate phosphatase